MRKTYIDNIRWITVVLVVIYHVIYMFNGVTEFGVLGPFGENQPQDVFQYAVYPWFMLLLLQFRECLPDSNLRILRQESLCKKGQESCWFRQR